MGILGHIVLDLELPQVVLPDHVHLVPLGNLDVQIGVELHRVVGTTAAPPEIHNKTLYRWRGNGKQITSEPG